MEVALTFDDALQILTKELQLAKSNYLSSGYDLVLTDVTAKYLHQTQALALDKNQVSKIFYDAAWELCRLGVIRPGEKYSGAHNQLISWKGEGYSLTAFGKEWLSRLEEDSLLPSSPSRFSQIFSSFQALFGNTFFQRAQEAVFCYQAGVYLACCAMCDAAAESILLAAAFQVYNKEKVLKTYFTANGRNRTENLVFGQAEKYIKDRYSKYTDLISYWRDESAHGHLSSIDHHQAYISLISLLRFAQFMRDHWGTVLQQRKSAS